jgi:crotonobetainyl-CoA:carnitine CoA-transferase CaiB-like acyl-CoA transferase
MIGQASGDTGPLVGLRVIDMATLVAGPGAARYLGDFGADVIKVESPAGDSARTLGLAASPDDDSYYWKFLGRNKRSVVIDLKSGEGSARFRRMVGRADVLVENLRVGKLEVLGLGPDVLAELNPGLVVLRVSGFGQSGPYAKRPGFATLAEAMSGYASISGEPDGPPLLPPTSLTDDIAALAGAFAVMVALWERERSGLGQVIDVNLLESMVHMLGPLILAFCDVGYLQPRLGSGIPYSVPRGTYRTADGEYIAVSASANRVASRLLELLGVADDPRFTTHTARIEHRAEIDDLLQAWIGDRTAADVLAQFERVDAAAARVYSVADLVSDSHIEARDALIDVDGYTMQGLIAGFSRTPGAIRFAGRALGSDTLEFDDWLGESDADIDPDVSRPNSS